MKQAFLICSERIRKKNEQVILSKISDLGYLVQSGSGLEPNQIRESIAKADLIFLYWSNISKSCIFEAGIAFALDKHVSVIVTTEDLSEIGKYSDVIQNWQLFTRLIPENIRIRIEE